MIQYPFSLSFPRDLNIHGLVLDFHFLEMYLEPTLVVLHEDQPSCTGRFANVRDSMTLTVFSLNVTQRQFPKIWSAAGLPLNCHRVLAVPAPVGGVIVCCTNALLYLNQTQYSGLALNRSFSPLTLDRLKYPVDMGRNPIEMEWNVQTQVCFLNPHTLLIVRDAGEFLLLHINLGATAQHKLELVSVGTSAVAPACIATYPHDDGNDDDENDENESQPHVFFLGSRSGDSLLIQYQKEESRRKEEVGVHSSLKRKFLEDNEEPMMKEEPMMMEDDEDDVLLYGSISKTVTRSSQELPAEAMKPLSKLKPDSDHKTTTYAFKVLDSLLNVGQITSMGFGKSQDQNEEEPNDDDEDRVVVKKPQQTDVVVCGGEDASGSLSIMVPGLRPTIGTEAELQGCRAMWTVKDIKKDMSVESSGEKKQQQQRKGCSAADDYLVLSLPAQTLILKTSNDDDDSKSPTTTTTTEEEEEEEEEGTKIEVLDDPAGFYTEGMTLAAGNFFNHERIVQVYRGGIRVMHHLECVQELIADEELDVGGLGIIGGEAQDDDENAQSKKIFITLVDILDPFILLCLSDGSIRLVRGDAEDFELLAESYLNTEEEGGCVVTAASLYLDSANVFSNSEKHDHQSHMEEKTVVVDTVKTDRNRDNDFDIKMEQDHDDDDSDDDLLYGNHEKPKDTKSPVAPAPVIKENNPEEFDDVKKSPSSSSSSSSFMMCAVCTLAGTLKIYRITSCDFKLVMEFPYFAYGPRFLQSSYSLHNNKPNLRPEEVLGLYPGSSSFDDESSESKMDQILTQTPPPTIADVLIQTVGPVAGPQVFSRQVIVALLLNGDVLMYTSLSSSSSSSSNASSSGAFVPGAVRFRRSSVGTITRPMMTMTMNQTPNVVSHSNSNSNSNHPVLKSGFRYPMFTRFDNIAGRRGIFFRGLRPAFVLCDRGQVMFVPLNLAQSIHPVRGVHKKKTQRAAAAVVPVLSFAPFHDPKACPFGFVYFHTSGIVRIGQLPSAAEATVMSSPQGQVCVWHKISLGGVTPHSITYLGREGVGAVGEALSSASTYAVIVSRRHVWKKKTSSLAEGEVEPELEDSSNQPSHTYVCGGRHSLPHVGI